MTITFRCDDKDMLVAYLYDEVDTEQRRLVEAHLRTCLACLSEVESLRHARQNLGAWQPPEADLNFQIAQKPATVLRPARWSIPALPAWVQAAAAVLVIAAGAAIANVQVRYGNEGLTVSTGWMAPSTVAGPDLRAVPQPVAGVVGENSSGQAEAWRPALAELEADLRRELQTVQAPAAQPVLARARQGVDSAALIRRVQDMLQESEQRQRQELALRMTQFGRDVEMQRRIDLRNIRSDFGQLNGRTGAVEGNQREIVNLLRRVSTTPVP